MKSIFSNNAGIALGVNTNFIPATKQVAVEITSTYEHSADPTYARRLLQLNLSREALHDLVQHLGKQLDESFDPEALIEDGRPLARVD